MTNQYKLLRSGKVRDIHYFDKDHLIFVTSNRLSAFDVVLPDEIPGKGKILNDLTEFWMKRYQHTIPNHLTDLQPAEKIPGEKPGQLQVVKKLTPVPVEAIVRGYLVGSGWKEYQQHGTVCGIKLVEGLKLGSKLPVPIFTPSTKAEVGDHDENITWERMVDLIGTDMSKAVRHVSMFMYYDAAKYALERGIIIADTKFEFGLDEAGSIHLMDEVLTPDSSRFWSVDEYEVGISPPSFDKQIVRDYLETLDWDKTAPGPLLPTEILEKTAAKYQEVADKLMN